MMTSWINYVSNILHKKGNIPDATAAQMAVPRLGISPEYLRKCIKDLSSDIAPGLGSSRNEHITSIMFSDEHAVPPLAKAAVDHVCGQANAFQMGDMSDAFYITYMATRLIAGNKIDPTTLQQGETMPCCPLNIGGAW
eukprot:7369666-Ditylum_brightwellii.AAC.1